MSKDNPATVKAASLQNKALHDTMLRLPVRDGYCRFYGGYVAVGSTAEFPDGSLYLCEATERFVPIEAN